MKEYKRMLKEDEKMKFLFFKDDNNINNDKRG